jgi:hypothetical protein
MWPDGEGARDKIRADFDASAPPALVGDRRQEIVFIGQVGRVGLLCSIGASSNKPETPPTRGGTR